MRVPRGLALLILLASMTVAVYLPSSGNGFVWDDDLHVQNNRTLRSLEGLRQIWFVPRATPQYYPLVHTTYWVEYRLFGVDPAGYHLVNVLLHLLVAVLAWRVLELLRAPAAWSAAAVFALHPVHVESVAWITERKNVLSAAFYLGAGLSYLLFALGPADGNARRRRAGLYALSLALFLCALFSKTVTCTLPAALLLVLWWQGRRIDRRELLRLAPFFLIGAGFGLLTAWIEWSRVGARGPEWNLSLVDRCLIAGRAVWFYLGELAWPANLSFVYPRWSIDAGAIRPYLFPAGAAAGLLALWRARGRIGRGAFVAGLYFVITLFPALGFFNTYPMRFSFVADHFQYLASLGPLALIAAAAGSAVRRLGRRGRIGGMALLVSVLVILGSLTWRRQAIYLNLETLWRDTLRANPDAWLAHTNLAGVLKQQGRLDEAIGHYREALRLKPDNSYAHDRLGVALRARGRLDEAMDHYREALRLDPRNAQAHNDLGLALKSEGKLEEAIAHYREALQLRPQAAAIHYNLGRALAAAGRLEQADVHYREALRLDPGFDDPRLREPGPAALESEPE